MVESVAGWFARLGDGLRNAFALPLGVGGTDSGPSTDRDFDRWVANDPMVTMDPASRYGDDATGFLAGSEKENPDLGDKGTEAAGAADRRLQP